MEIRKDLITKEALYFVYNPSYDFGPDTKEIYIDVIPDSVSHSYNANWESRDFQGRISPVYIYKNGSDETYSFSIVVHEDVLQGAYQGKPITTFIDDIKSLSYPVQASGKRGQYLPKVYFQLGEISGFGIVNTSIEWNKPFRRGHYVYATVNFDITIDRSRDGIKVARINVDNSPTDSLYANAGNLSEYTSKQIGNIINSLNGVASFIPDIVDPADNAGILEKKLGWANQEYNFALMRLKNLYSAFETQEVNMSRIDFISEIANRSFNQSVSYIADREDKDIIKTYNRQVKEFEDFLEDYYKKNPNMLLEEKVAVLEEFKTILMNIRLISQEAIGYGAGS